MQAFPLSLSYNAGTSPVALVPCLFPGGKRLASRVARSGAGYSNMTSVFSPEKRLPANELPEDYFVNMV